MSDSISFGWDPIVSEWESKLELLRTYQSINGNTSVPENHVTKEGVKLGEWVSIQRSRKNRMSAYRVNMLDSISFNWDLSVTAWEHKFELLCQYKSNNGNTNVPRSYATKEGVRLGEWVSSQRLNKHRKTTTKFIILDSISFDWDPAVNEWKSKFELLRLYKSTNGNTGVPKGYTTKEGVKLGDWVSKQRCLHRQHQISTTRISMLDSISFDWDPTVNEWESKFKLLQQYMSINVNTKIPKGHVTKEGVKLGVWATRQRHLRRKNQLSMTRISMFDSISFDWNPVAHEWENNFKLLCQYKSNHGKVNVLNRYVTTDGVKLGAWVLRQRTLYHQNLLSTTRISMLGSISFDWDPMMRKRKNYNNKS